MRPWGRLSGGLAVDADIGECLAATKGGVCANFTPVAGCYVDIATGTRQLLNICGHFHISENIGIGVRLLYTYLGIYWTSHRRHNYNMTYRGHLLVTA